VLDEFSAQQVTIDVLKHLERRRPAIVADEALVKAEIENALEPVRAAYRESELPQPYLDALVEELLATIPARWLPAAQRFTSLERRDFALWRGGDVVARVTYVFIGLLIGGLCVALPFIPIWENGSPSSSPPPPSGSPPRRSPSKNAATRAPSARSRARSARRNPSSTGI